MCGQIKLNTTADQATQLRWKDSKEMDLGGFVGGVAVIGAVIATIVGSVLAVFFRKNEVSELRQNNAALRAAGVQMWDAVE
jgi:hypothetical protein